MIARKFLLGTAIISGLFVSVLIAIMCSISVDGVRASQLDKPFSLIDDQGRKVDQSILKGHPALVYFGYTHCPQACPTTLLEVADWLNVLGEEGKPLRAYFFSIDPERDTQSVMHEYVTAFSPRIIGITGDPAEMTKAANNWLISVKKLPSVNGDYHMDHTVSLLMIGADGRLKGMIPYGTDSATALSTIRNTLLKSPAGV